MSFKLWEVLPGILGIQHNLIVLGQKEGVVMSAPTHVVAIAFPARNDAQLKEFQVEDVEVAKEWVLGQVKQFYEDALAHMSIPDPVSIQNLLKDLLARTKKLEIMVKELESISNRKEVYQAEQRFQGYH